MKIWQGGQTRKQELQASGSFSLSSVWNYYLNAQCIFLVALASKFGEFRNSFTFHPECQEYLVRYPNDWQHFCSQSWSNDNNNKPIDSAWAGLYLSHLGSFHTLLPDPYCGQSPIKSWPSGEQQLSVQSGSRTKLTANGIDFKSFHSLALINKLSNM